MIGLYECSRCGVVTEVSDQVCRPRGLSDKQQYCGTSPERDAMCGCIREQLPFVCAGCGRPAEQAELLCDPLVLG